MATQKQRQFSNKYSLFPYYGLFHLSVLQFSQQQLKYSKKYSVLEHRLDKETNSYQIECQQITATYEQSKKKNCSKL